MPVAGTNACVSIHLSISVTQAYRVVQKSVPILNHFFDPLKIFFLQIFLHHLKIGGDYTYAAKKINALIIYDKRYDVLNNSYAE